MTTLDHKKAENAWRAGLEAGEDEDVEIDLVNRISKNRPNAIGLKYSIDGVVTQQTIRNTPRRTREGNDADS